MSLAESVNSDNVQKQREKVNSIQIQNYIYTCLKSGHDPDTLKDIVVKKFNCDADYDRLFTDTFQRFKNAKETFWTVNQSDKGAKIELQRALFLQFLQNNGIYRYYIDDKQYIFIQVNNKIVKEVFIEDIKHIIYSFLQSLPDKFDTITRDILIQFILKGSDTYFSKGFLHFVSNIADCKDIKFQWNRDTKTHHFQYYKNAVVITDKDGNKVIPFKNLYHYIWKSQIIDREFVQLQPDNYQDCEYSKLIFNICGQSPDNYLSLCSIIGYLLHQYKDSSFAPAIIMNDEVINDYPSGGTGKGLFFKALKQLINVVIIDGKNFKFDKNFAFERVSLDTQLILIEDVEKGFLFEKLFSIVTEGMAVEKKGKAEFYIQFCYSPKIGITTNYAINGDGSSHERRRIDVELSQFYNITHRPIDDFGHMLFDDWNIDEWQRFDNFMIGCVQLYLSRGLIPYSLHNLKLKRFKNGVGPDFYDFMTEEIKDNQEYDKKEQLIAYNKYSGIDAKQNSFTKWIKKYSEYSGRQLTDNRHKGVFYFGIVEESEKVPEFMQTEMQLS
jgi:hypothetical protein